MEKIFTEFQRIVQDTQQTEFSILSITRDDEDWTYDNIEEFFSEVRRGCDQTFLLIENKDFSMKISSTNLFNTEFKTYATVKSSSRENIIRLSNVIDKCGEQDYLTLPDKEVNEPSKPKIFIGHGNSEQWRDLKDHLQDKHGYEVLAYETGSRAGHTIRDVISDLMNKSLFAILVMTGEDKLEDGKVRARQNVIHEIGLFQGKLGFIKAIVLKEDGTEEFSNINGIHQIRYSIGNIKETFGDVLATLAREFGNIN